MTDVDIKKEKRPVLQGATQGIEIERICELIPFHGKINTNVNSESLATSKLFNCALRNGALAHCEKQRIANWYKWRSVALCYDTNSCTKMLILSIKYSII